MARFKSGFSGNPAGRPPKNASATSMMARLARGHAEKAMRVMAESLDDPDPRVRMVAAKEILDRAYGKAKETVEVIEDQGGVHGFDDESLNVLIDGLKKIYVLKETHPDLWEQIMKAVEENEKTQVLPPPKKGKTKRGG